MNEEKKEITEVKRKFVAPEVYRTEEEFLSAGLNEAARECRKRYLMMLSYPQWHTMKQQEQGDALGVPHQTISVWRRQVPHKIWDEALKVSRERMAELSLEVDGALMVQCREGNVKAMELYYRRLEGWNPAQSVELTRGRDKELDGKANFELLKALVAGLSDAEKAELLGGGAVGGGDKPVDTGWEGK